MKNFLIALQFLTRIRLVKQKEWTDKDFSMSVPWFPLVGAVIGLVLFLLATVLSVCDPLLKAVILLAAELLIVGITLTDGLMDTADGVFSGRERERILEIMKDSHVGANGVVAFVMIALLKVAFYQALPDGLLLCALFVMPVVGKLTIVVAITNFPSARAQGIGKLFTRYTEKKYAYRAAILTALLIIPAFSWFIAAAAVAAGLFGWLLARHLNNILGGLTGDTYGFIGEFSGVFFLGFVYCFSQLRWPI